MEHPMQLPVDIVESRHIRVWSAIGAHRFDAECEMLGAP